MINGIQLKRLRHNECLQMMQHTLEILKEYGTGDTQVAKYYIALQQITDRLDAIFMRLSPKATGKKIQLAKLAASISTSFTLRLSACGETYCQLLP
jgi:hypothetical protein